MRCPECNTEITNLKLRACPNCGAPLDNAKKQNSKSDEPRLSKGMIIFIIAGTLFLILFAIGYFINHQNDPEYTRTMIEPDTTLADKTVVTFDTLVRDTLKNDSINKAEKKEAEKIYNSIRKKPKSEKTVEENKEHSSGGASSEGSSQESGNTSSQETAPIVAPTPKIEQIEN